MKLHVTKVESNLKGGVSHTLEPKTVVLGRNGSGKSALVQAMELALTGRVGDLAGRDLSAREADLLALAPGRAGELWAEVKLSDGSVCRWSSEGTSASAKKGKSRRSPDVDPERCFPLRAVVAALKGSPETARKFFLQHAGAASGADVLSAVPAGLHSLLKRAVVDVGGTATDKLLHAITYAKERVREGRSARSRMPTPSLPLPTTAQVAAVRADLATALLQLQSAEQVLAAREAAGTARERLPSAEAEAKAAHSERLRISSVIGALESSTPSTAPDAARAGRRRAAREILEFAVANGVPACPLCGGPPDGCQAKLEELRDLEREDTTRQERADALATAKADLVDAEAVLAVRTAECAALLEAIAAEPPKDFPLPTAAAARVQELQATLSGLAVAEQAWAMVKAAESEALDAKREAADWALLVDACQHAVARLLDGGVSDFTARVQAHLPGSDEFVLRLRDGEREVLQVGRMRGETLCTALSGAEWARVTAALAAACAPKSGLAVVCPEERAFDPDTLTEVLQAFTACEAQVIVCSPVAPTQIPKGWGLVEVGTSKLHAVHLEDDIFG